MESMSKAMRQRAAGAQRTRPAEPPEAAGASVSGPPPVRPPTDARAGGVAARAPRDERERDPLAAVLGLGSRAARVGATIGLGIALISHGALSGQAVASGMLREIRLLTRQMRGDIHDYLWATYEVDLTPEKKPDDPPKPPEPEPEPEPAPAPKVVAPADTPPPQDDPYEPPPAAAAAPNVITQEPDPDEPLDMTSFGIATGTGEGPGYGMVAGAGTAKTATQNPNAQVGGVPGGKGTGGPPPPPPPPAGPDRSKAASLVGSASWNCPFPPEAEAEDMNLAYVTLSVTVRPDGTPLSVKVVNDPGHGFGRAARLCALQRRYTPALDREGKPITATTPPIRVKFTR